MPIGFFPMLIGFSIKRKKDRLRYVDDDVLLEPAITLVLSFFLIQGLLGYSGFNQQ
jgi:hypothetical protein